MNDFHYQTKQRMIDTMQSSLKQIRQLLGIGVQEFSELIGLTRQTINNLETGKIAMSPVQFIAVCAIIDNCIKDKPEFSSTIKSILNSNDEIESSFLFDEIGGNSFLEKWFSFFPSTTERVAISQQIGTNEFEKIAKYYRVFLDISVLVEDGFSEEIKQMSDSMALNNNRFIIPFKVVESLQQMIDTDDDFLSAKTGLQLLLWLQQQKLVDIRGEKTDVEIVSTFVSVFAKFKCLHRLALITCDSGLAKQILALNTDVIGGFDILVLRYSKSEGICQWNQKDFEDQNCELSDSNEDLHDESRIRSILQQLNLDDVREWGEIN